MIAFLKCSANIWRKPLQISKVLINKSRLYSEKSLDINTNIIKDVILYKYDNPKHFRIVNIFAFCQFVFWSYLSVFSYQTLKDIPVNEENKSELVWWRRFNLGEVKYKHIFACGSFLIGYGILTISWLYTLKSVRYLVLNKGGKNLTIVCYTPLGQNRMFTLNLNNVSCKGSRITTKSQLPLKVKGHLLHYILDMKGEFKNPSLFDHTAGLKRTWKTI